MYFELSHVLWLTLAALAGLYGWRAHAAKEQALRHARRYCRAQQVQLLDDSLVVRSRRLVRSRSGLPGWRRRFSFEFTATGDDRYGGHIDMDGLRMAAIQLEAHRVRSASMDEAGRIIDMESWRRLH